MSDEIKHQRAASPVGRILIVNCAYSRNRRTYFANVEFDRVSLGIRDDSWLWLALKDLSELSTISRAHKSHVCSLQSAIDKLLAVSQARKIMRNRPDQVGAADIRTLFRLAEEHSVESKKGQRERVHFRSFVLRSSRNIAFREAIETHSVRFRSRFGAIRPDHRPLISDLHDIADPLANLPIGALSAPTAKETRELIKDRVSRDLDRIRRNGTYLGR